jgi:hypothetical protein
LIPWQPFPNKLVRLTYVEKKTRSARDSYAGNRSLFSIGKVDVEAARPHPKLHFLYYIEKLSMPQKFIERDARKKGSGVRAAQVCIMVWWPAK